MGRGERPVETVFYLSSAPRVSTRSDSPTPGPRAHITGIAEAAAEAGYEVKTLIAGDRKFARKFLQGEASESGGSGALGYLRDLFRLLWAQYIAILAWFGRPTRPFVVYERFGTMQDAARLIRRKASAVVVECNGLFFREANTERSNLSWVALARRRELRVYRNADLIVAVSDKIREHLIEEAPTLASKVLVVRNGVDTSHFSPRTLVETDRQGPSTVVWVGTLVAWQAIDELLSATAALRDSGVRLRVRIAGDGPARAACEDLAKELNLDAEFLGSLDPSDVPKFLNTGDFAFCGHKPTGNDDVTYHSPLKLYEYASCGLPIVASRAPDSIGLLRKAELGSLLYEPGDQEQLQRAIGSAIALEPADPRRMLLRQEIVQNHSWSLRFGRIMQGAVSPSKSDQPAP